MIVSKKLKPYHHSKFVIIYNIFDKFIRKIKTTVMIAIASSQGCNGKFYQDMDCRVELKINTKAHVESAYK